MLKLKYLFENHDLAKALLTNWAHDTENLDAMLAKFRISANAVYPFCQDGAVCFLRIAPVSEKQPQNIVGEMAFIDYLLAHDFPALVPLKTKGGTAYVMADTPWGSYYATAFARVRGTQLEDIELTGPIAFEYGKTLGRLHSLSADFHPEIKKWTHAEALDWIEDVLAEHHAPDCARSELASLEAALSALSICGDNYGLVHYDFELDNVFYDAASNTCAVIDFDDGMYHWYALDIAQVFDSLEDALSDAPLEAAKAAFLDGYAVHHSLCGMEALLPLMRRFINLYTYARLIRCVAEHFADEPTWFEGLRTKLNATIGRLEDGFLPQ